MANKTVPQLATMSGIAANDLFPIYDTSELGIEKLKNFPYSDLKADIKIGVSLDGHSHTESDVSDLDKYSRTEVNSRIATVSGVLQDSIDDKSDTGHTHDDRYYTETEVNALTWVEADITDLDKYTQAQIDTISGTLQSDIDGKATSDHTHDDRYYTENEIGNLLADKSDTTHTHGTLYLKTDGTTPFAGHIVPSMAGASGTVSAFDIGSPTKKVRNFYAHDAYIDAGSLYVNEKKVIEDVSDIITVSTDVDNDIRVKTTGQGIVYLNSEDEIDMHAHGGYQVEIPNTLSTKHMNFTNMSANGNITFSADGTGAQVQLSATEEIDLTATTVDVNGNMDVSGTFSASNFDASRLKYSGNTKVEAVNTGASVAGNLTIAGNLTVSGTTTTVDTQDLLVTDKIITVNNGEVGAGMTGGTQAGMDVDRGSETNYRFVFDETQDNFRVGETGSEQAVATREDAPINGRIPYWDSTAVMFKTDSGLPYDDVVTTSTVPLFAVNTIWSNDMGIYWKTASGTNTLMMKLEDNDVFYIGNSATQTNIRSNGTALLDGNQILTTASTIDADTLGGIESSQLIRNDESGTISGTLTATELKVKTDGGQMSGTFEVGSTPDGINPIQYNGYFYGTKVYNAIWNDIADFQELAVDTDYVAGKCYFDTLDGAKVCDERCQKSVIGILSDTFGFGVGNREGDNFAPFAVAGWVLAYVAGTCEPGDPLTNDAAGNLVKMNQQEKSMYPERLVAIYKKPEPAETWGPEGSEIQVNGRHWVKIK